MTLDEISSFAGLYLQYAAHGAGLAEPELSQAENAYVLWDWEGLASLAYEQYLKRGRGAFIGPRAAAGDDSITVTFDYTPSVADDVELIAGARYAGPLRACLDHYHPEYDFVVVWLRADGTARHAIFSSNDRRLQAPQEAYRRSEPSPKLM